MTEQTRINDISNLIADLTMKGASNEELTKLVRYSMCVINGNTAGADQLISGR